MATELDITVPSKRVQWGGASGEGDIVWMREDVSGATFKMEVRNEPGDTGSALLTLNSAAAGSEGISATYDAGYVHPETGEVVGATTIRLQINQATMEALATAADPSDAVEACYDIQKTVSGVTSLWLYGSFTYAPGVTR
jgi:hypothetical protein